MLVFLERRSYVDLKGARTPQTRTDMFNKFASASLLLGLSATRVTRVPAFAPVAVSHRRVLPLQRANMSEGSIDVSSYMGGAAPEGTEDYISKC